MAPTVRASWSPSVVPRAMAFKKLHERSSRPAGAPLAVTGVPVSGNSIFEIKIVPGAVITTAVSKWRGSAPQGADAPHTRPEQRVPPPALCAGRSALPTPPQERLFASGDHLP